MISRNDAKTYIRRKLREELTTDFCNPPFRIFRERDLHACCYYHLRNYFSKDNRWIILNEPNLRNLKGRGKNARPDIVLLFAKKDGSKPVPTILFELKFRNRHAGSGKKDTKVVRRAANWVKKAYYIETIVNLKKTKQPKLKSYRNEAISIPMQKNGKEFQTILDSMRNPQNSRKRRKRRSNG